MNIAHILLSGLLILASFWHWAYWDLDLFFTSTLTLDLNQILSIHLTLASSLCLGFGLAHLTGFLGPGMWTSDSLNLVGSIRFVKASFNPHKNSSVLLDTHGTMLITLLISEPLAQMPGTLFQTS